MNILQSFDQGYRQNKKELKAYTSCGIGTDSRALSASVIRDGVKHRDRVLRRALKSRIGTDLGFIQSLLFSHCMMDRRQEVTHCMTLQYE